MKLKLTLVAAMTLACASIQLTAMPTEEETKQAEPVVKKMLAQERAALESGKKTPSEVAAAAMKLADETDTDAAKLLLMKGAFALYVKDGNLEKAVETMKTLEAAISDMPPQSITNMIEVALLGTRKKEAGARLYKLLDEAKAGISSHIESKSTASSVEERSSVASILKGMIKVPGRDYWLSATELTQGQWESVMGYNLSEHKGVNLPVDNVSRDDCDVFLEKLNQTEEVKSSQFEFRLPELEEWKYAAWAGSAGQGSWIKSGVVGNVFDMAWVKENSLGQTHAVATKAPNAFGFYDMLGNVWEWLSSPGGDAPVGRGSLKGCAFNQVADKCTWKQNWHIPKTQRYYGVGMRLAAQIRYWPILRRAGASPGPQEGKVSSVSVGGYTWPFFVRNGEATIMSQKSSCAVSPAPTGDISIPATLCGVKVTSIGHEAFKNCTGLKSVTIPAGVKVIESEAFKNCKEMTSVTIPEGVTHIDSSAFADCGLTSVILPSSVKVLGGRAFWRCAGLTSVAIPDSVTSIGDDAFNGCRGLKSVVIPDSVTDIGSGAFLDCKGLTSVTIPAKVEYIGEGAFGGCSGLKQINVAAGNKAFAAADGVLYNKYMSVLLACPGDKTSLTIPSGVTRIGVLAFGGCNGLKSVTIPQGVKGIGDSAFKGCSTLTSVTIPSGVTRILQWTFEGCSSLESVTIQGNVAHFGHQAFLNCHELTSFTMCGERPEAPNDIFQGCDKLKSIHVPANAKSWAGMKEWQGIPLVFDGKAETNSSNSTRVSATKDLTGPYGILMQPDPGCEKGAEYVLKRLVDDYLPAAVRYYGDPFGGKTPSRVYRIVVRRNKDNIMSFHPGSDHRWKHTEGWTISLPSKSDKFDILLEEIAASVLTVCEDPNWTSFTWYVNKFVCRDINGGDPIPQLEEDIRIGLSKDDAGRKTFPYMHTSMWAVLRELHVKHPKFIQEYCDLKNAKYNEGKIPGELSFDQMAELLGEVTGENVSELFKKYGVGGRFSGTSSTATPLRKKGKLAVAKQLQECDFLLNKDFKKNAKYYLCLFSASWCGPCRAEMPRIAKTYAETLKDDPDIELIHFSWDQNDEKALAWAKEHDVKFPVVKYNGGNPLDLHTRGIPHLFIVKADGTLMEEGHPMKLFTDAKLRSIKTANDGNEVKGKAKMTSSGKETIDGVEWAYIIIDGQAQLDYASSSNVTGSITIPSTLGGCPVTSIRGRRQCQRGVFEKCCKLTSVTIPSGVTSIGDNAFYYCVGLTSVTIPNGVTNIGAGVFSECRGLESVTIGNGVTNIGKAAFYGCSGLTSVTIPDSVTSLGDWAFFACTNITCVTLGSSMTNIGAHAFHCCSGLTGITIPDGVTSIGDGAFFLCSCLTNVTIGGSVTSIGEDAFSGCSSLTSVSIPDSVTSIGNYGFSGCRGLTSVTIPDGVTKIGTFAFGGCNKLTSVAIPKGVKVIGPDAFKECAELTSVTMRGERPEAPNNIFQGCGKLKAIHVPASAKSWAGMKDWLGIPLVFDAGSQPSAPSAGLQRGLVGYWPFDGNANDVTKYCNNGILHDVTQTEDRYGNANKAYRFSGSGYIEVPHSNILNMTNAITMTAWIKPHNWYNKTWAVIMQKGDKRNCNYQFAVATNANRVFLCGFDISPRCSQHGLELNKWQQIALTYESGKSMCVYCNGVQIGMLKSDRDLQPNNGSLFIGYDSFGAPEYFIGDMDDVRLFNRALSAEEIQELYKVESNGVKLPYEVVDDEKRKREAEREEQRREIVALMAELREAREAQLAAAQQQQETVNGYTWSYRVMNGEATIVKGKVGKNPCAVSPNPTGDLSIPATLGGVKVTSIGGRAFSMCDAMTSVAIPSSVTNIGWGAFYDCYGLTSVTIPEGVKSIGWAAFSDCCGLTSVTIPASVMSIESDAFSGTPFYDNQPDGMVVLGGGVLYAYKGECPSSVTIPTNVTRIENYAFQDWRGLLSRMKSDKKSGLESVMIPSSVTNIGERAFSGCNGLKSFSVAADNPSYKTVSGLLLTKDGKMLVAAPRDLTNVTIPNGVSSIGEWAFSGCSGLTSVTMPNSVTNIGRSAFGNCSNLTSVTIPDSVKSIGELAFSGCSGLTSVTIPDSVTSIGQHAFIGTPFYNNMPDGMVILGGGVLCGYKGRCPSTVEVSSNVTCIACHAFYGEGGILKRRGVRRGAELEKVVISSLEKVVISSSVTNIGNSAFSYCGDLVDVTMCGERPYAPNNIFMGCGKLKAIHVPANAKSWAGMKDWFGIPLVFDAK